MVIIDRSCAFVNAIPLINLEGTPSRGGANSLSGLVSAIETPPPSPADEAFTLGLRLGLAGQWAAPPSDLRPDVAAAFRAGHSTGYREYEDDQLAWVADRDAHLALLGVGELQRHPIEVIEALGVRSLAKGVA